MQSYANFLRNTNRYIVINCQSSIRYIDVDSLLDIISDIVIVIKHLHLSPPKSLLISTYLLEFYKIEINYVGKNFNYCIRFVDHEVEQV